MIPDWLTNWLGLLDERERQEIGFALAYVKHFNHGTPGHLSYTVIAKLAGLLTLLATELGAATTSPATDEEPQ